MNQETLMNMVIKAQQGDRESLDILISNFLPSIKKACRYRSFQDRDDLEQVCFASRKCLVLQPKVPRSLASIKSTLEFVPWPV